MPSSKKYIFHALCLVHVFACRPSSHATHPNQIAAILPGGTTTIQNRSSSAFSEPAANLSLDELKQHLDGDEIFEAAFVRSPSLINPGLGPNFNNNSCRSCHIGNGRGMPVLGQAGTANSPMLVRVSIDPAALQRFPSALGTQFPGNGPIPVPGLGIQLQDQAVFGTEPELIIQLTWEEVTGRFTDGTPYTLRQPKLSWSGQPQNLALINDAGVQHSIRQTPPVVGLGLLEAVADETLLALEDPHDKDGNGIRGRLNRVWDPEQSRVRIGRFGWKASAPSLLTQTAAAFAEDMGVHNYLFPDQDGKEEITPEQVAAATYYTQTLGVPDRMQGHSAQIGQGEQLFQTLGCAECHRPSLKTDANHPIAALRDQTFAAYTDMLLHDMGEGLSDHRADYLASGSEWRTSPLWGLGVAGTILPYSAFLHDGRAKTLEEAILWHGGEAEQAQLAYKALPRDLRRQLLAFLHSL